jgi:hypothetical protein
MNNFHVEFHVNLTDGLVTDDRSRTDGGPEVKERLESRHLATQLFCSKNKRRLFP